MLNYELADNKCEMKFYTTCNSYVSFYLLPPPLPSFAGYNISCCQAYQFYLTNHLQFKCILWPNPLLFSNSQDFHHPLTNLLHPPGTIFCSRYAHIRLVWLWRSLIFTSFFAIFHFCKYIFLQSEANTLNHKI